MRLERHSDHLVWVGGPVPRGAEAITIGPVVSMRESAVGSTYLHRHELVHVRQWRRFGVIGFSVRYLGSYLMWRLRGKGHLGAYRRIPMEIEADWIARRMVASTRQRDASVSSPMP